MGLLWICAVLLLRVFKFSSAQKFNIAFTAQLSGFVFFIYTLLHAYQNDITLSTGAVAYANSVYGYINLAMPYISIVYLGLLVYKMSTLFFAYRFTQGLRKHDLKKISADNRMFVEDVSELLSLRKKVRIYLSGKIKCPLTIGFLKPVILIPVAAVNYLTAEQMEAVILHELAHIKRADYFLFLFQAVIEKIFFFNIFSKMLGDIVERERENACDDCVLQFKYNSMHYAEALLKLTKLQATSSFAMAASGKKKSLLLMRIKRLMPRPDKRSEYSFNSLLFSFFTLIIALGAMASFTLKGTSPHLSLPVKQETVVYNEKTNAEVTISGITPAAKRSMGYRKENTPQEKRTFVAETSVDAKLKPANDIASAVEVATIPASTINIPASSINITTPPININIDPAYLISVNKRIDSFTQVLPEITSTMNRQLVVTPETYKQVLSYQNFKDLETMLATTGDSIKVIENEISKDSYKKLITIETTDENGNKYVYHLIVELYQ